MFWHKDYLERVKRAISSANEELGLASYLGECGKNSGIRAIWSKRAFWLSDLIHAAREQVKQQEFVGNWLPCVECGDVWFFCSCCGFVIANSRYDVDYEDIGIKPIDLNQDMELDYCPHCGQLQRKYFEKEEVAALRKKWENGEL